MTKQEIAAFIRAHTWIFAKTMAHNPHEYTLRKHSRSEDEFVRFVVHIREAGYVLKFAGRPYKCLDVGPHRYWTMGAPLDKTILINRAKNAPKAKAPRRRKLSPVGDS